MAEEGLKIVVGADVEKGVQGVERVNKALTKLPNVSNTAAFALTNLGRVAQDAPFGFIAIQNNINPLLESFQRLKAETGGTGSALKALVGSLAGPAGVGLAVSLATSLLVVFGDKLFGAKKNSEGLTEAEQKRKNAVDGIVESQAKEIAHVGSLVTALESGALARNKQVGAIHELQKIAPDYFSKLDAENTKITDLVAAYNKYTQSIIGSIEAQIKISELTEATRKRLDIQRQFKDATAFINTQLEAGKTLDDINKSLATEKVTSVIREQLAASDASVKINDRLSQSIKNQRAEANKTTQDRIQGVGDVITALLAEQNILKSIKPTDIKIDPFKAVKPIGDATFEKIRASIPKLAIDPELTAGWDKWGFVVKKNIDIVSATLGKPLVTGATINNTLFDPLLFKARELAETITELVSPAFDAFFDSLITGSGNAFKAFANAIKQIIAQMVAAIAKAAIFAAITALITGTPFKLPNLGALFGFTPHAKGGITTGPSLGLIGEAGPEAIIPLRDLNKVMGSLGGNSVQVFIAEHRLEGSTIVTSYRRETGRLGGTFS